MGREPQAFKMNYEDLWRAGLSKAVRGGRHEAHAAQARFSRDWTISGSSWQSRQSAAEPPTTSRSCRELRYRAKRISTATRSDYLPPTLTSGTCNSAGCSTGAWRSGSAERRPSPT